MNPTTIRELDCEFLYCLPIGNFFADVESKIAFFDLIARSDTNPFLNLLGYPEYGSSSHIVDYQSDRGAVGVLTSLGLDRTLYSFAYPEKQVFETDNLSASRASFTLSENGTICVCYKISNRSRVTAANIVDQLAELRLEIKNRLNNSFLDAVKIIEKKMNFHIFRNLKITDTTVRKWVKSFEIIDFDFKYGRKFGRTVLRDYYSGKSKSLPSDLTGFIRMTRKGVWTNYKPTFQKDFWSQNLGNRSDEIWLVHVKHFFRFHPERNTKDSVKDFYAEVSLIIQKLIHSVAHVNFLSETMSDYRLTESSDWRSVIKFADNLSEQAPQQPEYSKNDFLSRLVINILEEFNFDASTENFHKQLDELKASTLSYTSLLSAKRVTQLTVVVLVVTALQLALSPANSAFWGGAKGAITVGFSWFFQFLSSVVVQSAFWWAIAGLVVAFFIIKIQALRRFRYRIWLKGFLRHLQKRR